MKKGFSIISWLAVLSWLLTACGKTPEVFSIKNFTMTDSGGRAAAGVKAMTLPAITGKWTGIEHEIVIEESGRINGMYTYSIGMIDTMHSRDSGSTWYEVDFITAGGRPYAEVVSWGLNRDEHDFNLVLSTYAKINKLTSDTIIVEMLNSEFTEGWLKAKGYKYFITAEDKGHKDHPLYLTENLPRLAALLKELYRVPQAFQVADTIVRMM